MAGGSEDIQLSEVIIDRSGGMPKVFPPEDSFVGGDSSEVELSTVPKINNQAGVFRSIARKSEEIATEYNRKLPERLDEISEEKKAELISSYDEKIQDYIDYYLSVEDRLGKMQHLKHNVQDVSTQVHVDDLGKADFEIPNPVDITQSFEIGEVDTGSATETEEQDNEFVIFDQDIQDALKQVDEDESLSFTDKKLIKSKLKMLLNINTLSPKILDSETFDNNVTTMGDYSDEQREQIITGNLIIGVPLNVVPSGEANYKHAMTRSKLTLMAKAIRGYVAQYKEIRGSMEGYLNEKGNKKDAIKALTSDLISQYKKNKNVESTSLGYNQMLGILQFIDAENYRGKYKNNERRTYAINTALIPVIILSMVTLAISLAGLAASLTNYTATVVPELPVLLSPAIFGTVLLSTYAIAYLQMQKTSECMPLMHHCSRISQQTLEAVSKELRAHLRIGRDPKYVSDHRMAEYFRQMNDISQQFANTTQQRTDPTLGNSSRQTEQRVVNEASRGNTQDDHVVNMLQEEVIPKFTLAGLASLGSSSEESSKDLLRNPVDSINEYDLDLEVGGSDYESANSKSNSKVQREQGIYPDGFNIDDLGESSLDRRSQDSSQDLQSEERAKEQQPSIGQIAGFIAAIASLPQLKLTPKDDVSQVQDQQTGAQQPLMTQSSSERSPQQSQNGNSSQSESNNAPGPEGMGGVKRLPRNNR